MCAGGSERRPLGTVVKGARHRKRLEGPFSGVSQAPALGGNPVSGWKVSSCLKNISLFLALFWSDNVSKYLSRGVV